MQTDIKPNILERTPCGLQDCPRQRRSHVPAKRAPVRCWPHARQFFFKSAASIVSCWFVSTPLLRRNARPLAQPLQGEDALSQRRPKVFLLPCTRLAGTRRAVDDRPPPPRALDGAGSRQSIVLSRRVAGLGCDRVGR
jgi:hypothetical protein